MNYTKSSSSGFQAEVLTQSFLRPAVFVRTTVSDGLAYAGVFLVSLQCSDQLPPCFLTSISWITGVFFLQTSKTNRVLKYLNTY